MRSLFLKSVTDNNIDAVKTYLNDPSFEKNWMDTLNLASIIKESVDIGILLIQAGMDVNVTMYDDSGSKPLLAYAIDNKLEALIEVLLARPDLNINETFNIPGTYGSTSLLIHAFNQQANGVVKALLAKDDIDLSVRGGHAKNILNIAIENKDVDLVKDILNHKNFKTDLLQNVYLNNVIKESVDIGILLIQAGMDINVTMYDNSGNKPLLAYAIDHKLDALIEVLLARPDLNINQTFDGGSSYNHYTSLLIHAFNQQANGVVKALLAKDDIDLSVREGYAKNIFNKAIESKNVELVADILNHKNFKMDLIQNVYLNNVIKESVDIGILLIQAGMDVNVTMYDDSGSKPLLAYAIDNKLEALIEVLLAKPEAILARPDIKISQNDCGTVVTYLNEHHNIKPSESLLKELIINSEIDKIIEYLKQVNFDWATKFNNGETILHLLLARNDANNTKTLEYADYLLQQNTPSNEPVINVNQRDNNGDRVIDLVKIQITNDYLAFIKLLRDHGSVEPKEPISSLSVSKLILDNGSGTPPDGIEGNKEKAETVLQLMLNKYKLTDQEINNEITQFKANPDLATIQAVWGGGIDNVLQVIDKLSTMHNVQDRLTVSWDFEKVLGILIHITKNNEENTSKLIDTLSQIKMCDLSKLINLLAVGQDEIIESIEVDYTKKSFESFEDILGLIHSVAFSILGDKMPLAFIKWKNDLTNNVSIEDPEQWCGYTQKIQGIFNKIFAEHAEGITNSSYHFTDGLKLKIIDPLFEKIISKDGVNGTIKDTWKSIMEQGAALLAAELFDKIVAGEKTVDSIAQAVFDYPLSFGELPLLDASTIKHYYALISDKYGEKEANQFAYLLQDCFLNHDAEEYLHHVHENPGHDDNIVLHGDIADHS